MPRRPARADVVTAVRAVVATAEEQWRAARARLVLSGALPGLACRLGCAWCCHQVVTVSAAEILSIADHIETSPERASLVALVADYPVADEAAANRRCMFLNGGVCRIYEVRPMMCRSHCSTDESYCRHVAQVPEHRGRAQLPDGRRATILDLPFGLFAASLDGLARALADRGLAASRPLDLHRAMRLVLADSQTVERWLARKDAFRAA